MRSAWIALPDQERARLTELAQRASRSGQRVFTPFLSPAEAEAAEHAAQTAGVSLCAFGGYDDAERRVGCFQDTAAEPPAAADFPLRAVSLAWNARDDAPAHRDVLGALLGLGIVREKTGDILILPEEAIVYVDARMASFVAESLSSAGRVRLEGRVLPDFPPVEPASGTMRRDTVPSLRLDAVLAAALHLSREHAAEAILSGGVKVNHLPALRTDLRLSAGDAISIRGYGRVCLREVGIPTRKGRLPIALECFGMDKR